MSKWLSVEYHKQKGVFKAEDNDQLRTIDDICAVFNTKPKYHGYLRVGTASVPNKEKLEIGILIFITAAGGATIFRKTKTHSKNSMKRMR